MEQEFLVEQAETRVDMKVSSRRPRHFRERMAHRRHDTGWLAGKSL